MVVNEFVDTDDDAIAFGSFSARWVVPKDVVMEEPNSMRPYRSEILKVGEDMGHLSEVSWFEPDLTFEEPASWDYIDDKDSESIVLIVTAEGNATAAIPWDVPDVIEPWAQSGFVAREPEDVNTAAVMEAMDSNEAVKKVRVEEKEGN